MKQKNKNWLYEFEATNIIRKEDGSQETEKKHFAILKPNRKLREDGELYFAAETSRFAKAGVLPKAAWSTILSNGGGSISEPERELYGNLLLKFRDLSFELQSILIKSEGDRTEVEKTRSNEIIIELEAVRKDIQSFEASQIAIFENTAEAKARNKTILWWVLNLARKKDGENFVPFFEGDSYEKKLEYYDSLEEEEEKNDFVLSVMRRITYLVTLWFLGKANTDEDFEFFDKNYIKDRAKEESKEEEAKEELVAVEGELVKQEIIEEIKPE